METKLDKVRERIAKLLKLTQENGASEAEAQTALAFAQRLMEEYAIGEAEVAALGDHDAEDDDEMAWHPEFAVEQPTGARSTATWVGLLGYRIGYNLGCATMWERDERGRPSIHFYGRRSDCNAAAYLLRLAMAEVERLARAYPNRKATRSYRTGVASAIAATLKQEWINARAKYASNERALVVLDRARQAQREAGIRGRMSRSGGRGYADGRRDGRNVNLNSSRGNLGSGALRLGAGR